MSGIETVIYFIEAPAEEQRKLLCRWVERFFEEGKKVQVVAGSTLAAQHIDQLLWTFSQGSFIPHRIVGTGASGPTIEPVVITIGEIPMDGLEVLVCDGDVSLDFAKRYPTALHFVIRDDPERRQESRLLWQKAKDMGLKVQHLPYSPSS